VPVHTKVGGEHRAVQEALLQVARQIVVAEVEQLHGVIGELLHRPRQAREQLKHGGRRQVRHLREQLPRCQAGA
jgi:hypothetical protein